MAYNPNNLSVLSYANGHTQWHYVTRARNDDPLHELSYFDPVQNMLRAGDVLIVSIIHTEPLAGTNDTAEVDDGALCIVRRVKPHVVLRVIGG